MEYSIFIAIACGALFMVLHLVSKKKKEKPLKSRLLKAYLTYYNNQGGAR
jgi:hypothetical protein